MPLNCLKSVCIAINNFNSELAGLGLSKNQNMTQNKKTACCYQCLAIVAFRRATHAGAKALLHLLH